MATSVNDVQAPQNVDDQKVTLLQGPATGSQEGNNTPMQQVLRQAFKSTANLANLLPTGTLLTFRILTPVFTNMGTCDVVFKTSTEIFMALCGLSCMILSFTDSFIDEQGMVRYVFPTFKGLWVIDGSTLPPPDVAVNYRIKVIDFAHAFMILSIFTAVAVLDPRVLSCLYPKASSYMTLILKLVPLCIAAFSCALFVIFPTNRHGIGFPIVAH